MKTIRLDFNDKNETVLYLKDSATSVTINKVDHGIDNHSIEKSVNRLEITANGPGTNVWCTLDYDYSDQRDIDYRYAIQMVDELMGVEGE